MHKQEISFDDIKKSLQEEQYQDDDIAILEKAFEFARKLHDGQYRISEEPYIIHPLNVALCNISKFEEIVTFSKDLFLS